VSRWRENASDYLRLSSAFGGKPENIRPFVNILLFCGRINIMAAAT
jgi:hypothetical protein